MATAGATSRIFRRSTTTLTIVCAGVLVAGLAGNPPASGAMKVGHVVGRAAIANGVALPSQTLTATLDDLGTLGGAGSWTAAVDGTVVVGTSTTASGRSHAFAFDLAAPSPVMRDLGTLGGASSEATGVSGHVVVGTAQTAAGRFRAFAYDLDAATPRMRGLGTLGGPFSRATAISGHLVAGSSAVPNGSMHAFSYDLAASSPAMRDLGALAGGWSDTAGVDGSVVVRSADDAAGRDRAFAEDVAAAPAVMRNLGTLGGWSSRATAVSGQVVVGSSEARDGSEHGFASDLSVAASGMRDLGTLPGGWGSYATAVDGHLVVGDADIRNGREMPFVYDLAAATPQLTSLGSLGGNFAGAEDVDGPLVVGSAERAVDDSERAFVYDLSAATPELTDLGPDAGMPTVVSGTLVAGTIPVGRHQHAAASTVEQTTAPSMRFDAFSTSVQENAGQAVVTVVRAGDSTIPVTVDYSTRGIDTTAAADPGLAATAGDDYATTSGTLSFAAGQTSASFAVPIHDDTRRERAEAFLVALSHPTGGAVLGTPRTFPVVIRASDQQPDVKVAVAGSAFVGAGVLNTTGLGQTVRVRAARGETRTFTVRVAALGGLVKGGDAVRLAVHGCQHPPGAAVGCLRNTSRGIDLTTALRSPDGLPIRVNGCCYQASYQIAVRTRIRSTAPIGSRQRTTVSATWQGDVTHTDLIRVVVRVTR